MVLLLFLHLPAQPWSAHLNCASGWGLAPETEASSAPSSVCRSLEGFCAQPIEKKNTEPVLYSPPMGVWSPMCAAACRSQLTPPPWGAPTCSVILLLPPHSAPCPLGLQGLGSLCLVRGPQIPYGYTQRVPRRGRGWGAPPGRNPLCLPPGLPGLSPAAWALTRW